jgi:hypothetical protein
MLSHFAVEVREVNGLTGTKQNTLIDPGLIDSGMMATIPAQYERDVVLSFRFRADSSRLLYALSIPEYIEVWLHAPDAEELQFVFNLVTKDSFRIDLYRSGALQTSVHGSCQVMGVNQVRHIWKIISPAGNSETLVDMKLLCGSGGCVLALKHSGFRDALERAWCSRMWQRSLERLGRLMEKN